MVEVQVDAACRGVGQSQARRTHEPDAVHARPQRTDQVQGEPGFLIDVTKVAAKQAAAEFGGLGSMDLSAVEKGPLALYGREHLLTNRVIGQTGNYMVVLSQGDDGAEVRNAVGVVPGAVQGIDHPFVGRVAVHRLGLFGQDAEFGELADQQVQDCLLGG